MNRLDNPYILAKYDVSGIQDYIFASNRLRENAGASFLVTQILEEYLPSAFQEAASLCGADICLDWKGTDKLRILKEEKIRGELLYIGGGNALILFRDKELFCKVGENFGIKVAKKSPGVTVAVAYYETHLQDFEQDMKYVDFKMEEVKRKMVRQPLHSTFPVVQQDNSNHQPITCWIRQSKKDGVNDKTENMTKIQSQKLKAYSHIRNYKQLYPDIGAGAYYGYPEEMDKLCQNQEGNSFIAVIHIDGNGMGNRVKNILHEHKEYACGVSALRAESQKISNLFRETYATVLQKLWDLQEFVSADGNRDDKRQREKIVPLRPIIMDGDDFTILCTADLAIPFTVGFLSELFRIQENDRVKITACAGIAFVHSHFPFNVAYSLAEESCSQAKEVWYEQKERLAKEPLTNWIDFQVIKENKVQLTSEYKSLRKRPFSVSSKKIENSPDDIGNLYYTLKKIDDWPTNRIHKIYRALLEGENAMELLRREFISRGYNIENLVQGGWEESPLFDALELWGICRLDLLDYFLKIE